MPLEHLKQGTSGLSHSHLISSVMHSFLHLGFPSGFTCHVILGVLSLSWKFSFTFFVILQFDIIYCPQSCSSAEICMTWSNRACNHFYAFIFLFNCEFCCFCRMKKPAASRETMKPVVRLPANYPAIWCHHILCVSLMVIWCISFDCAIPGSCFSNGILNAFEHYCFAYKEIFKETWKLMSLCLRLAPKCSILFLRVYSLLSFCYLAYQVYRVTACRPFYTDYSVWMSP